MIVTYLRSSSYNAWDMCPLQYFGEYVLGIRGKSGLKADKGTIVHKVMEIIAWIKLSQQNGETQYVDDIVGDIDVLDYSLDEIVDKVYDYYSGLCSHHDWKPRDLRDCRLWVHKGLTDHNAAFDPRNQFIIQPEQHFDIVIDKPWAAYKYNTADGVLEGNLAIKGTIDLITKVNDDTLEVIDYKTGRRLDWASGQEKTLEKLYHDPQLKIYHYALSQIYPEYAHIIMTINFINDGGAFSVCFDKDDLPGTEELIRRRFTEINKSKRPPQKKSWKCSKLCQFGKKTFADETRPGVLPILEYRDGQTCAKGDVMTMCEQLKHDIDLKGLDAVVREYTVPGHSAGKYKAPGSVE